MNDKRYYWLKLEENYFDIKVQKALRKLPSGAEMLICYLKMQLRYLNRGGLIEFNGLCQDISEEIALDIDEEVDLVKMTLALLTKWNVIEQCENDSLFLLEMQGRIGSKTDSAIRVEKYRKKQDLLHCNKSVQKCNSIQEIEIEKDIDISSSIYEFVEENFGRTLSSIEIQKIEEWNKLFTEDILKYAVVKSVMANIKTFSYVEGILKNWQGCNYKTLEEIKDKEIKNKKPIEGELFEYDWLNNKEE